MNFIEIILIGFGLSLDALSVSICKGLALKKVNLKNCLIISLYFGIFQMMMPIIGYILSIGFYDIISSIDHYVVFVLLSLIGGNMILEKNQDQKLDDKINFKSMVFLSIATSIDALVIGMTFVLLKVNIIISSLIIGLITFTLCFIGVKLGNKIGKYLGNKSLIIGGSILIIIGLKILLEHLNLI